MAPLSALVLCVLAAACGAVPLRASSTLAAAASSAGHSATATGTAWTPGPVRLAPAPNDLAGFWVDYGMQLEAMGYLAGANGSGADSASDSEPSPGGIDVAATAAALTAPIKEYQAAEAGGAVSPTNLKASLQALIGVLGSDASFGPLDDDALDGSGIDADVMSPATIVAAVTARNALFERLPADSADDAKAAYVKMLDAYSSALDAAVRSKYAKVVATTDIDWDTYEAQFAALVGGPVAQAPGKAGPGARAYLASFLRTGAPNDATYDALMNGKAPSALGPLAPAAAAKASRAKTGLQRQASRVASVPPPKAPGFAQKRAARKAAKAQDYDPDEVAACRRMASYICTSAAGPRAVLSVLAGGLSLLALLL